MRFFTTARASASCLAPSDSRPETNAGMPVGIAETAIAVPSSIRSSNGSPRITPTITMNATAVHAMMPSTLVSESSSRWSGERTRVTEVSIVAIRPISVSMPVAVTSIAPVPRVTEVFWNSMSARSPSGTSGEASTAGSLATGALSPVSAASWASSVAERSRRPSAGTMSPASTSTMSPGTTSAAGTSATAPSRRTRLCGTCIFDSASTLARAFSSWREPSTRLRITSSATKIAGRHLADDEAHRGDRDEHEVHRLAQLRERDRPHRRRLLAADLVRARTAASRDVASAWVRPSSASLPKAERTADSSCANQLAACGSGAVVATSTILGSARAGRITRPG